MESKRMTKWWPGNEIRSILMPEEKSKKKQNEIHSIFLKNGAPPTGLNI